MIDFTNLITWCISVLSVIIIAIVGSKFVPFLREKGFYNFVAQMVKAVVTYFTDGHGKEKFEWVFAQVEKKYGKYFDVDEIKNAIQSAYVDMCIALGKEPAPSKGEEYEEYEEEEAD